MQGIYFKSKKGNNYFYNDLTGFIQNMSDLDKENKASEKYIRLSNDRRLTNLNNNIFANANLLTKYLYDSANGFKQLLIETTSQCNLRCKYCVYSDHYQYTKTYANNYMDFKTAKMAVDYYFKNIEKIIYRNPTRTPVIGFYGGEPLLNFKLIKEIVEYINSTYSFYDEIQYNVTTNGILFKDEIQDFLVKNNFAIIISLDGNKENHDRNRVKVDGTGTFDDIMRNIRDFRLKYKDYLKLGISSCYDTKSDLLKYKEFFDKENLFIAKLTPIDPNNTTYYDQFTDEDILKFNNSYKALRDLFLEEAKNDCVRKDSFLYSVIGISYSEFAIHPVINETRPDISPYTASCIPGEKIYVTTDGKYHICEKINTNHSIGNVNEGLDFGKMVNMINEYRKATTSDCSECNVSRFCYLCYQHCSTDKGFTKPENVCSKLENYIKDMLENFINVLEEKPDIFEDITIEYYNTIYEMAGILIE